MISRRRKGGQGSNALDATSEGGNTDQPTDDCNEHNNNGVEAEKHLEIDSQNETKKPESSHCACNRGWWHICTRCCSLCAWSGHNMPSSTPKNFPFHSEKDMKERPCRVIYIGKPQRFSFRNNFVKTSKYEVWNFLPKFLFEEFNPRTKLANIYFLVISCLQCIRAISNTNGVPTTLIPLSLVVIVDAIFQILEDMARHRADEGKLMCLYKCLSPNDLTNRYVY